MNSIEDLNKRLSEFDANYDNEKTRVVIEQINGFKNAFPKEIVQNLTIQEYVLGEKSVEEKKCFSWWIEFGTDKVAQMGGFASKHKMYISSKTQEYEYPNKYGSKEECFEDIKRNLVELYNIIENDDIDKFVGVDLPHNQAIKISYLLNSDQFTSVLSVEHLNKICKNIGIDENGLNSLQKNRKILEYFRENEISKEWHTWKIADFIYSDYGYDLKKKEKKVIISVSRAYGDDLLNLLLKKRQVILYGPPGTGKTYITKRLAVDFIEHVNVLNDLIEYEELPSANGDQEIREVDNILFNKLKKIINTLLEVDAVARTSMVGYYSISKITNKKKGLVWVEYPSPATGSFTVHLRKENNTNKYPQEILNRLADYRSNGWGGYPVFTVNNEGNVENAIELVSYAYENL